MIILGNITGVMACIVGLVLCGMKWAQMIADLDEFEEDEDDGDIRTAA